MFILLILESCLALSTLNLGRSGSLQDIVGRILSLNSLSP